MDPLRRTLPVEGVEGRDWNGGEREGGARVCVRLRGRLLSLALLTWHNPNSAAADTEFSTAACLWLIMFANRKDRVAKPSHEYDCRWEPWRCLYGTKYEGMPSLRALMP